MTVMDIAALEAMMATEFPQAARLGAEIEHVDDAGIRLRLAVGEVTIGSPGEADACAHATITYAIPPKT